jgi:SAM-dependent methyltransferase
VVLKEIPFYFKAHSKPDNGGFSHILPFDLYFDEELQLYRQRTNEDLQEILRKVYEIGSLVDGSISNESGTAYIEKVKNYILGQMPDLKNKLVLEVGCGNGVVLHSLSSTQAELWGVDPGNHQNIGGIKIIHDFFPTALIDNKFDLVISFFVLEHIPDPVLFLREQKKCLKENGKIIFGVPDCQPFFDSGDYCIFIHEHFNYFTKLNVEIVAGKAGLLVEDISILEGMLIVTMVSNKNGQIKRYSRFDKTEFEEKTRLFDDQVDAYFRNHQEEEVAVYVPGRALNVLYLANMRNCRLVDDNSELHGKYLPWLNKPIESFDQMLKDPPKYILIYSRTFGLRIKEKCIAKIGLRPGNILTIADLSEHR